MRVSGDETHGVDSFLPWEGVCQPLGFWKPHHHPPPPFCWDSHSGNQPRASGWTAVSPSVPLLLVLCFTPFPAGFWDALSLGRALHPAKDCCLAQGGTAQTEALP